MRNQIGIQRIGAMEMIQKMASAQAGSPRAVLGVYCAIAANITS
jgi:hypothetical protein